MKNIITNILYASTNQLRIMDYDMSNYDVMLPSINHYIELLSKLNKRITNLKNSKISLEKRKQTAFKILLEAVVKLDGDELQKWKDILENVFNPKEQEKGQPKKEKEPMNFDGYNIGDDVIYYTNYTNYKIVWWGAAKHEMNVKCRIVKLNKCSITLQKYESDVDFTDGKRAFQEQTHGKIYFNWTDKLLKEKVVVKNLKNIMREVDEPILYKHYMQQTDYDVDFGN